MCHNEVFLFVATPAELSRRVHIIDTNMEEVLLFFTLVKNSAAEYLIESFAAMLTNNKMLLL